MRIELLAGIHENVFDRKMIQIDIVAPQIASIQPAAFLATPWENCGLTAEFHIAAVHHPAVKLSAENQQILIFYTVYGAMNGSTIKGVDAVHLRISLQMYIIDLMQIEGALGLNIQFA